MATRIYGANPGGSLESTTNAVGPTATSAVVALVVDLASLVTDSGTTRAPDKHEILQCIELIKQRIIKDESNLT